LDERLYKKCFKRWLSLTQVAQQRTEEEHRELYQLFVGDLRQYRLSLSKVHHVLKILDNERDSYETYLETVRQHIHQRSEDIVGLREQLEHEKRQKDYRRQYDAIAKTIVEYPSREESERETRFLQETVDSLKEEQTKATKLYESQKSRVLHLLSVLDEVELAMETRKSDANGNDHDEEGAIAEHHDAEQDTPVAELEKEPSSEGSLEDQSSSFHDSQLLTPS
jgi:chromosome segregation ATPase